MSPISRFYPRIHLAKLNKITKFSFILAGKPTGFELNTSSNKSLEHSTPDRMNRYSLLLELYWVVTGIS